MRFQNPVIPGFYPDPSVCRAGGVYYMVHSTFQYFPGVALSRSEDLVNWRPVGSVLTEESQLDLRGARASGGVYAPTIRHDGTYFYMVTTNTTTGKNFYVRTKDPESRWSEPVTVDQDGIDPSLFFEDGKAYFLSNGTDDRGIHGVVQCEIDIETGKKLSPSVCLWQGTGGRFLESPHMYHIGRWYYLMAAEGGTEYGHMITCARAEHPWGPFTGAPNNPILTNRNKAPFEIQGTGHGDLVQDGQGNWYLFCLGFRQNNVWEQHHTLGRETFLAPVTVTGGGWLTVGHDGTMNGAYDLPALNGQQEPLPVYIFDNTAYGRDWLALRAAPGERAALKDGRMILNGTEEGLNQIGSPAFLAIRQKAFDMRAEVTLDSAAEEAGMTVYMDETAHYDLCARKKGGRRAVCLTVTIGPVRHVCASVPAEGPVRLRVNGTRDGYAFACLTEDGERRLGEMPAKYISTETAGGFTGVMIGLYAVRGQAVFSGFSMESYEKTAH